MKPERRKVRSITTKARQNESWEKVPPTETCVMHTEGCQTVSTNIVFSKNMQDTKLHLGSYEHTISPFV